MSLHLVNELSNTWHATQKWDSDHELFWSYILSYLGLYVAALGVKLGISANVVTVASIVCGLVGCVFLGLGTYPSIIAGSLLVNLWFLLDCSDGHIARYTHNLTPQGHYLDDLGAYTMYGFLLFSTGIGVSVSTDHLFYGVLGGIGSISLLLMNTNQFVRAGALANNAEAPTPTIGPGKIKQMGDLILRFSGLPLPLLVVLAVLDFLPIYVIAYAVANTAAVVFFVVRTTVNLTKGQRPT